MRTETFENRWKILFCVLFDILILILPIVVMVADFRRGWQYVLAEIGVMIMIVVIDNNLPVKGKPLVSSWLLPGGSNVYRRLYEIETL